MESKVKRAALAGVTSLLVFGGASFAAATPAFAADQGCWFDENDNDEVEDNEVDDIADTPEAAAECEEDGGEVVTAEEEEATTTTTTTTTAPKSGENKPSSTESTSKPASATQADPDFTG